VPCALSCSPFRIDSLCRAACAEQHYEKQNQSEARHIAIEWEGGSSPRSWPVLREFKVVTGDDAARLIVEKDPRALGALVDGRHAAPFAGHGVVAAPFQIASAERI